MGQENWANSIKASKRSHVTVRSGDGTRGYAYCFRQSGTFPLLPGPWISYRGTRALGMGLGPGLGGSGLMIRVWAGGWFHVKHCYPQSH